MVQDDVSWGNYFSSEISKIIESRRFAQAVYQIAIISTGLILLWLLANKQTTPFPVSRTIWSMLAWLALVIVLPVPEKAKSEIEPFEKSLDEYLFDQNSKDENQRRPS